MEIYLVRHGKAEPGADDDARVLTELGRQGVERIANRMASRGIRVQRIDHSPLTRARETAEILAKHLKTRLRVVEDLRPGAEPETVRERLASDDAETVMLVGHNPFMEEMAGLLLAEDTGRAMLTFHAGSVARLVSIDGSGRRFTCDWLLSPSILK